MRRAPWDGAYLLDYLRPKLPPEAREFLAALLDAINDPGRAPELDRFPERRDTPPVPRDRHDRMAALPSCPVPKAPHAP